MDSLNRNKLNQLLKILPKGAVATQSWLSKYKIYRQLADVYCKSGWLKKIGRGAYARAEENIHWSGGLSAIQSQLNLSIHAGGKTALQMEGFAHFLAIGKEGSVFLLGEPSARLPKWFQEYDWGVSIHYSVPKLFYPDTELGLTEENFGQYTTKTSSPERAMMEVLSLVPKEESFENARYLMEELTTLRQGLVQMLLENCRSIKVARLFLFLAEECDHKWVHELNIRRINLGKGKRVIVKRGRLDPVYNITVANEPFTHLERQTQDLQNKKTKSPAVRLMSPPSGHSINLW